MDESQYPGERLVVECDSFLRRQSYHNVLAMDWQLLHDSSISVILVWYPETIRNAISAMPFHRYKVS